MSKALSKPAKDLAKLEPYDLSQTVPISAQIPLKLRILGFSAIVLAGACGGLCGFATAQVLSDSQIWHATGIVTGSPVGAVGVAVITSLCFRARPEWKASEKPRTL